MQNILVTFATKHGSTSEIAKRLANALSQRGFAVTLLPIRLVRDLTPFDAVVAVYYGRWQKEAVRFLRANDAILSVKDLWLFSSGPTGTGSTNELLDGWKLPTNIAALTERLKPRGIMVFHGVIKLARLTMFERAVVKRVDAPLGDYRDWDSVAAWGAEIATTLSFMTTDAA